MFLLLALALALPVQATRVGVSDGTCPMDGAPLRVFNKEMADRAGGYDSDFATYSSQGQYREYAVSTCPSDLFSAYGDEIALMRLSPAQKAAVQAVLTKVTAPHPDPSTLEVWDRYGIAAQVYEALGKDHLFIAELYVEASWVARDRAVGVYDGLEGPAAVAALMARGDQELAKNLTPEQRRTVSFNLARVAHRGGWNQKRDAYLAIFEKAGPLNAKEQEALRRFRWIATTIEPAWQDRAIDRLVMALREPDMDMDMKIQATYLLADLLRRRDRYREAFPYYSLVMTDERAPMNIREMGLFLAREIAPISTAGQK